MTACRRVEYSGRVQGVGFRWTVTRLASNHAVTGFVKNLANGHVQVVAEGTAEEIDAFLSAIEQAMQGYVEDRTSRQEPVQGFADFRIEY
jgi:acylphosphatase